jgi:hypothetical protein
LYPFIAIVAHVCSSRFVYFLLSTYRSASKGASRRSLLARPTLVRSFASGDEGKKKSETPLDALDKQEMPFGLGKIFGLGEPDNLIATDRERKLEKGKDIPDFLPDDLRKEFDELEIDNMEDLDELEDRNLDGYNDLGLVPPVGTGTFASPILIPSRKHTRAVGYTDPQSHAVFWFNIHDDDNTYYIPHLGLFFKMLFIPDEEFTKGHH